jgi:drug/metabolite transporter (DMT)-like permease
MNLKSQSLFVILCLFCTYFIWGSTYLAVKFGMESFPPFLMAAIRFCVAGSVLYVTLRLMGVPNPSAKEWRGAAIVGLLLPAIGHGTVCYVQQTVSSSLAALSIATAPIWMAIFSSIWGHHITRQEWLGITVGLVGIVLLNMGGTFDLTNGHGDTVSALLLIFAAASWSFGSVWSKHLAQPKGLMAAAAQMLVGGTVLMIWSTLTGETWPADISNKSWGAMVFMIVLGSLVAYSAYQWLLKNVRTLVASSNTFVNPIVAFAVGIWLGNEQVATNEYIALAVILIGVFLVLTAENKETK